MASTKSNVSTLNPWLAGRRVHQQEVEVVLGRDEPRRNRDVIYRGAASERVPIPELQDHLLIEKGYLPKYSNLPLQHFIESRRLSPREARNMRRRKRYWDKKQQG